ncbi:MAG: hypothetical protein IPP70_08135 [Elusimicrobia bacterium]|nr:hypothetical protein [Elusimicrobiota bacterium]
MIPPSAVSPGRPDLVVTNVSVTPSNPVAGEEVSFSAVIRNVGMTASPSGQLHAVAFYVDGRKFAWSTARWTGLEPGASANVEADGGVNGTRWTAEPGSHTAMAVVDDNDTLPETDEFNNKSEIPLACATAPAGRGLFGAYYNNPDFTDLRMTRVDPKIKFNWIHLSPDLSLGSDTFSVRWTGSVTPRYSESYTFHVEADDGVRLWVDGQLIIDQWAFQGATEHGHHRPDGRAAGVDSDGLLRRQGGGAGELVVEFAVPGQGAGAAGGPAPQRARSGAGHRGRRRGGLGLLRGANA